MNTFEQLISRQIKRIVRLDTGENFPPLSFPLAIYLMLEETSGLLISFGYNKETMEMSYMTLEDLQEEHGTEWGESSLNELAPSDRLNQLVGQVIKSIKVGQFNEGEKILGDDFVIQDNHYAGVIIRTTSASISIHSTKEGGQILFDKDELPRTEKAWTLQ